MINVFLSGLTGGAFYIAITWGVVISFRYSHLLSFANGAVASFACYCAYSFLSVNIPFALSALLAIIVGAIVNVIVCFTLRAVLRRGDDLTASLATLGPGLAIIGLIGIVWGQEVKVLPTPGGLTGPVSVGPYSVPASGVAALAIVVVATLGLVMFLRKTRAGVLLRAMADSRAVAALSGVPVVRFEVSMWALSGVLAACAGLLITPQISLSPTALTNLLLIGLAAAVLGGLESLTGLMLGGLLFGIVVAFTSYFFQQQVSATSALIVLIVVLALRPSGLLGRSGSASLGMFPQFVESAAGRRRVDGRKTASLFRRVQGRGGRWNASSFPHIRPMGSGRRGMGIMVLIGVLCVVLVPMVTSDSTLFMFATAAILVIGVAGQIVLSELTGLLSLAQGGFMLIGSYVAGLLAVKAGLDQPVAILAATLAGTFVAGAVGLCVLRLSGLYLAILTSIVSLAVPEIANNLQGLTGGSNGLYAPQLALGSRVLESSSDLFRFCGIAATAVLLLVGLFKRSHVGLMCRAVRDSEPGASSVGINVAWPRMAAFCLAGACAGFAGGITTFELGVVAPASFSLWTSIYIVFAAALAGPKSDFIGPILGALIIVGLPYLLSASGALSQVIFGVGLVAVLVARTFLSRPSLAGSLEDAALPAPDGTAMIPVSLA